eukprot:4595754-Pleurochrysis_carterae.AAC.1
MQRMYNLRSHEQTLVTEIAECGPYAIYKLALEFQTMAMKSKVRDLFESGLHSSSIFALGILVPRPT